MASLKSGAQVTTFPLDRMGSGFARAELRFEGATLPERSFQLRVFLDEPGASARTPTEANPHYLGTQYFFGVGPVAPEERARNRQLIPTEIKLNVTDRLRAFLTREGHKTVPVTLVAVDRAGNEIPEPGLDFEGLSLVTS